MKLILFILAIPLFAADPPKPPERAPISEAQAQQFRAIDAEVEVLQRRALEVQDKITLQQYILRDIQQAMQVRQQEKRMLGAQMCSPLDVKDVDKECSINVEGREAKYVGPPRPPVEPAKPVKQ